MPQADSGRLRNAVSALAALRAPDGERLLQRPAVAAGVAQREVELDLELAPGLQDRAPGLGQLEAQGDRAPTSPWRCPWRSSCAAHAASPWRWPSPRLGR